MPQSSKVHRDVNLGYDYPSSLNLPTASPSVIPRDALLAKNLKLEDCPAQTKPISSNIPILKTFSHGPLLSKGQDPMSEIVSQSQNKIEEYVIDLPYSKTKKSSNSSSVKRTPVKKSSKLQESATKGIKRSRNNNEDEFPNRQEASQYPSSTPSNNKTPIPNKTIFFSPSVSAKKNLSSSNVLQSTPKSVLNDHSLSNKKPRGGLNKQKFMKLTKEEDQNDKENNVEYEDNLACHVDTIMRMAVDSTMLGSSYNGSFSSTFSNVGDDSILGHRKKYPDILADNTANDDADKSVLETIKKKWNNNLLVKLKATRIDINDDDLKNAVNDN